MGKRREILVNPGQLWEKPCSALAVLRARRLMLAQASNFFLIKFESTGKPDIICGDAIIRNLYSCRCFCKVGPRKHSGAMYEAFPPSYSRRNTSSGHRCKNGSQKESPDRPIV